MRNNEGWEAKVSTLFSGEFHNMLQTEYTPYKAGENTEQSENMEQKMDN